MRKYIFLILLISLSCSDLDKEKQVENVLKLNKEVTAINQEFEKLKIDNLNLKNLRYVTQAGGKLEKNITNAIEELLFCLKNKLFYNPEDKKFRNIF